jgi:hypothetical protein
MPKKKKQLKNKPPATKNARRSTKSHICDTSEKLQELKTWIEDRWKDHIDLCHSDLSDRIAKLEKMNIITDPQLGKLIWKLTQENFL